jgi:hypothetical protein
MGYGRALGKAWGELAKAGAKGKYEIRFLSDKYEVDADSKEVSSLSCNVPAKDRTAIIALHYLARKLTLKDLPPPSGEWIDFTQIKDAAPYFPTFNKRTIGHLIRKFGEHPEAFVEIASRFRSRRLSLLDASVAIEAMDGVEIAIALSKGDDEFGPDANILYDRSITDMFCVEDIVVLTEMVVHGL